jgi:hypothetical protein
LPIRETAVRQSNATMISRPKNCIMTLIFNPLPCFQAAAGAGPTGRDPLAQPNGLGGAAPTESGGLTGRDNMCNRLI